VGIKTESMLDEYRQPDAAREKRFLDRLVIKSVMGRPVVRRGRKPSVPPKKRNKRICVSEAEINVLVEALDMLVQDYEAMGELQQEGKMHPEQKLIDKLRKKLGVL